MDEVEIIIPDQISDEFLLSRRESEERHKNEENQENANKTQFMYIKRLIQKVRKQSVLYDTNLKGFSKPEAKEKAWQQIAKELGKEVDECKNSWVKLRYLYQKHVRKLRKFLRSGNKNRKRRPIMPLERDLIFLWKFIADRSCVDKPRAKIQATTIIDCEDDDVVLLDDPNPVVVIDLDENDSPTKTNSDSTSQSKCGKVNIGPEVIKFIDALKEYPELYDVDNRYFDDYRRKGTIWNALANELKDKATKLMKLWIYLQVRYEWELNNLPIYEKDNELNKLLDFLKPYLLKNPKTVYKLSYYSKKKWQEPIEHFKNIFQLLAVIRKYPNVINFTDEYLLAAKKVDYTDVWFEISKTRAAAPGQCEITWLIMRHFYWELMNMRKHTYQLQDKWYFEGIISELYLNAKPLDQQKPSEPESEKSDIYANSYATSIPIPVDLEDNINATCIYNNPENSLYKTFTENTNPMFPKITSAKSLHVSAQNSFASLDKRAPNNSISILPATIKPANLPIDIAVVPGPSTQPASAIMSPINKNIQTPLNRPTTKSFKPNTSTFRGLPDQAPKSVTTISLPVPPLTPISCSALTMPPPSAMSSLQVVSTLVQVPTLPAVTSSSLLSSLPSIPTSSTATYLPASTSLKVAISSPAVPTFNSVSISPMNSSLPSVSSSTSVRILPLEPASRAVLPSVPFIPNKPSVPTPPPQLSPLTAKSSPVSDIPAMSTLLSTPQPDQLKSSTNNLAPLPKITGALSLLNPNEIMIELVATPSGNQLLVHGPPLTAKYSLSMDTTAKFIRDVMSIPRLHNKNIQPLATNIYWQYLSRKFTLPVHICKACWNFLADNFNHFDQIAPMEELMKPFKTSFKVWKESIVLFKNFETMAADRKWFKYVNDLPLLMNEISYHQEIFETNSNKQRTLPARITLEFSHITDIWDICIAFKNVFVAYMGDLERGVDNKWPQTWWRVLMKLKFLHEKRYKHTEPFYYIVRNKINEEIIRCAQNESTPKEETVIETTPKMEPAVNVSKISNNLNEFAETTVPAPKPSVKSIDANAIDPHKLMVCIRKHPHIYTKCNEWQKIVAWKNVAKEMESSVKDCRLVFSRVVKDYRHFVHRDPNGLCRINRKYFKPLKELHQSLQSKRKINIKTPFELNFSVDTENPLRKESDDPISDSFISDIKMENSKPSLVMKNWVYAIGDINDNSQRTSSLDGDLYSLFEKYRKHCT